MGMEYVKDCGGFLIGMPSSLAEEESVMQNNDESLLSQHERSPLTGRGSIQSLTGFIINPEFKYVFKHEEKEEDVD